MRLLAAISRWWLAARKTADALFDVFRPNGRVEAVLIYAHGPKKGQVYKRIKGRNIVTSWLGDGSAPSSGRDMMRRILIPNASSTSGGFTGELSSNDDCTIQQIVLGSGTVAETTGDGEPPATSILGSEIIGSAKTITAVELDPTNPYVTFITEWDESEVNQTITEAGLLSGRGDRIARKTFGGFTKTNEFTLQIRWQIRF